ncbi:MAG: GDSL family lipase [Lachnospiraceae bacterium]|nr:GDSL family lipase [Lachnospiraceae bacterium]
MIPNKNLKQYALKDTAHYKIHGRTNETREALPLFYSGSGIEVNVTGSELWIDIDVDFDTHEPWVWTDLNGAFMSRQMLLPGSYSLCLFRGMNPDATKNIRFFRELQAMSEDNACRLLIIGFRSDGAFLPVKDRPFKLEFIGDSITSGEGTYGAREDTDWLSMYMGMSRNYARIVSDELNAEYRVISQCGWGVLSSWDNDPRHNLPSCYEKICGLLTGETNDQLGAGKLYNFQSWIPDAIIVNLGTNDASAFEQHEWKDPVTGQAFKQHREPDGTYRPEDLMRFKQAVISFLSMLRRNNPTSHIVWVYGMLGYDLTFAITDAMNAYQEAAGDHNIAFLQLPNTTDMTIGSHAHPGEKSHIRAAQVIIEYLAPILAEHRAP